MANKKYNVVRLVQTCDACPSQWDAFTDDGIELYIRYRWGYLSVDEGGPLGKQVAGIEHGDDLEGYMTTGEMMGLLSDHINFNLDGEVESRPVLFAINIGGAVDLVGDESDLAGLLDDLIDELDSLLEEE